MALEAPKQRLFLLTSYDPDSPRVTYHPKQKVKGRLGCTVQPSKLSAGWLPRGNISVFLFGISHLCMDWGLVTKKPRWVLEGVVHWVCVRAPLLRNPAISQARWKEKQRIMLQRSLSALRLTIVWYNSSLRELATVVFTHTCNNKPSLLWRFGQGRIDKHTTLVTFWYSA